MRNFLVALLISTWAVVAYSAAEVAQTFTLDGRLYQSTAVGAPTLLDSGTMKISILSPDAACILYQEQQNFDTTLTDGYFSLQVGSATGAGKRTASDRGNGMATVFSNTSITPINGKQTANGTTNCTYTPTVGATRLVRVTVTPVSDGTPRTLSPDLTMNSLPNAVVAERAESLRGLAPTSFLQLGTGSTTQTNIDNVFSATNYPKLTSLLSGGSSNYVQVNSNGTADAPAVSGNASSPASGQFWYDTSGNVLKYYNGSTTKTVGTVSTGSDLTTGTIGGSVAMNTSGNIATSGNITATGNGTTTGVITGQSIIGDKVSANILRMADGQATPKYIEFKAPASIGASNLTYIWPSAFPASNMVLQSDSSGTLSWVAQASGSGSGDLMSDGSVALTQDWDVDGGGAGTILITGLADPSAADGAATRGYVISYVGTYADSHLAGENIAAPALAQNGQSIRWNNGTPGWEYFTPGTGDALTSGKLSQFSSTSSSELAGVINDESGSGLLIFGTSPTLTTPTIKGFTLGGSTSGGITMQVAATGAAGTYTWPSAAPGSNKFLQSDSSGNLSWVSAGGAGDALVANPLSQFAATTSAQLAGVLSDESGTGAFVLASSPTLTTPSVKGFTLSGATSGGASFTIAGSGATGSYTWPSAAPASNKILQSDSSGVLSWVTAATGDAVTTGKLSQFAATSSSELAGVLSDETGTGLLVYGTAPTLKSFTLGGATSGGITMQVAATGAAGTYTWPSATPSANAFLQSDNTGALTWQTTLPSGSVNWASPGTIGSTTANTGAFTTLSSGAMTITSNSATALAVGPNGTTNPTFLVDASTASAANGLQVKSTAAGSGVTLQAISSGASESLYLKSKGGSSVIIDPTSTGNAEVQLGGTQRLVVNSTNFNILNGRQFTFTGAAHSGAANVRFSVVGGADTSLTAATEAPSTYFDLSQTRQHASGAAITTQRDFRISPSTHSMTGPSSITDAMGVSIDSAPKAGTNATIATSHGLYIGAGAVNNGGTVTNAFGLSVNAPTGASTGNYAAQFLGGNVGIGTSAPSTALEVKAAAGQPALSLAGSTSGAVKFQVPAAAGTQNYTWPSATPASNMVLQSDNTGALSWVANGSAVDWTQPGTIGSTTPNTGAFTSLTVASTTGTAITASSNQAGNYVITANNSGGNGGGGGISATVAGGASHAVYGVNSVANGIAIHGINSGATAGTGAGVKGDTGSTGAGSGVMGVITGASNNGYGVYGSNSGTTNTGYGGYFTNSGGGVGLYATSTSGYALITGTGNVGIGTSTPSAALEVKAAAGAPAISMAGSTSGAVKFQVPAAAGTQTYTWPSATPASNMVLQSDNTGQLSWVAAGGGSSALSGITAATATNTIDSLNFAQTWDWSTATTQNLMTMNANALTTGSMLQLKTSNASVNSTNGLLYVANTGASTSGKVARIQANSTAGSGLTVLANGKVGIGTSSPSAPLHVGVGPIFVGPTPLAYSTEGLVLNSTYGTADLTLLNTSVTQNQNSNGFNLALAATDVTLNNREAGKMQFATNNSVRMTILSAGNVGVGTTAPNAKLDVKGTLGLSGSTSGILTFAAPATVTSGTYVWPAATPASNMVLQSDNTGALSWVTAGTGDALTTGKLSQFASTTSSELAGVLSDEQGTGAFVLASSPTLTTPTLKAFTLGGSTSGGITMQVAATGAAGTYVWPSALPASNKVLQSDSSGNLSWVTAGAGGVAGSDTQVQFNDGGSAGASANFTFNKTSNTFTVTGDIAYTGVLTDTSDRRLKTDIRPLQGADIAEKLSKVSTYYFRMKEPANSPVEYGVMAQEVEQIFPELVKTANDKNKTKSVNYMGFIAPMIETIRQLKAENDSLKKQVMQIQALQEKDAPRSIASIDHDQELEKLKTEQRVFMFVIAFGMLVFVLRGRFQRNEQ